jgi:hypothetical protein
MPLRRGAESPVRFPLLHFLLHFKKKVCLPFGPFLKRLFAILVLKKLGRRKEHFDGIPPPSLPLLSPFPRIHYPNAKGKKGENKSPIFLSPTGYVKTIFNFLFGYTTSSSFSASSFSFTSSTIILTSQQKDALLLLLPFHFAN